MKYPIPRETDLIIAGNYDLYSWTEYKKWYMRPACKTKYTLDELIVQWCEDYEKLLTIIQPHIGIGKFIELQEFNMNMVIHDQDRVFTPEPVRRKTVFKTT